MFYVLCSMFLGEVWAVETGRAPSLRFLHTDHLGSMSAVSDERGEKVDEGRYSPYGELNKTYKTYRTYTSYRFTGQEEDSETGLYNYNARLYNPKIGQFAAADRGGQGGNGYAYVRSNPLRFIDPSGNAFEVGDGGGGGRGKNKLEVEVSAGSVLNQPAEISSSQSPDPVQVYIPKEVDARSFWLLMANTVGVSFAVPIIVVAGPGGVITGIFITADLRAVASSFTNSQAGLRTKALSAGGLVWDLIPVMGSLRHGFAAGRAAREFRLGVNNAPALSDKIAQTNLVRGLVYASRQVMKENYARAGAVYDDVDKMIIGQLDDLGILTHELVHVFQDQFGLLTNQGTYGSEVGSWLGFFLNSSDRVLEWEAAVFSRGIMNNLVLTMAQMPFGAANVIIMTKSQIQGNRELLRGR